MEPSFSGPQFISGGTAPPYCSISANLALFWGSRGAWEGREIFHNLALVFPKENNLEHWGTSNPEGKVFLEAQCGDQGISSSCPVLRSKCVSWSLVDDINQYWSITRTAFPVRAQVNPLPLSYPLPTCSWWGQLPLYLQVQEWNRDLSYPELSTTLATMSSSDIRTST